MLSEFAYPFPRLTAGKTIMNHLGLDPRKEMISTAVPLAPGFRRHFHRNYISIDIGMLNSMSGND